jgi:hypothetical protein
MPSWPTSPQVKGYQMARKPTELRPLMTRIPERLRRRLEKAAARIDRSMNAEIIHRLEQSFERDDAAKRLEHALLARRMTPEEISAALPTLAAVGGPAGRYASLAAIQTEQGKAAATAALARYKSHLQHYQESSPELEQEIAEHAFPKTIEEK